MSISADDIVSRRLQKLADYEKYEEEWKPFLAESDMKKKDKPGGSTPLLTLMGSILGGAGGFGAGGLAGAALHETTGLDSEASGYGALGGAGLGALLGGLGGHTYADAKASVPERFENKMDKYFLTQEKGEEARDEMYNKVVDYLKENEGTEAAKKLKALGGNYGFDWMLHEPEASNNMNKQSGEKSYLQEQLQKLISK